MTTRAHRTTIGGFGEQRTAAVLDTLCGPDTVVLHGLRAPGMARGDLDHVVVRETAGGAVVLAIDSKNWAPGSYWAIGGRIYRGLSRFRPAEHVTVAVASEKLAERLGDAAVVIPPLVVIWPSRPGRIASLRFRLPGRVRWCRGAELGRAIHGLLPNGSGEPVSDAVVGVVRGAG